MHQFRKFIILLCLVFLVSCETKIKKSGITDTNIFNESFENLNKEDIIELAGQPSSIDPLDGSFIYFNETINDKNIFDNKVVSRNIYLIKFNENDQFVSLQHFIIEDNNEIKITKNTTDSEIIKTGLIEKVFGGVKKGGSITDRVPSAEF